MENETTESDYNESVSAFNDTNALDRNVILSEVDFLDSSTATDPEIHSKSSKESIRITLNDGELDLIRKQSHLSQNVGITDQERLNNKIADDQAMEISLSEERLDESIKPSEGDNEASMIQEEQSLIQITTNLKDSFQCLDEAEYFQTPLIELGRRLWPSTQEEQHYTKGCLWSPDGTCILIPVHLDGMHVIELPQDLYSKGSGSKDREISNLSSAVHVKEGGTVYDFAWYPFMQSAAPETCCWIATRQHEPIHMWDAFNGELRCSYRGYDQVDEVEAAISVAFSTDGEKVLGGYKKSIKVFDTNKPGRDCSVIPVKKAVSCFAIPPTNNNTVTCGSWNGYIDHYDLRSPKVGSLFTLGGHTGGITWLKYTKTDPLILISGARKDNQLLLWDMRNYVKPLLTYNRNVSTNQRIYFDLSPVQQWLASGDSDGVIHIWDLMDDSDEYAINVHNDCCNAVQFHPSLPIIASSSGQYHFCNQANEDQSNSPLPDEEDEAPQRTKTIIYENSLVLSWIGAPPTKESASQVFSS